MSIVATQSKIAAPSLPVRRRSIADPLAPLDQIAAHSPNLVANQAAPVYLKEFAFIAALKTILDEYRKFIAYAPNL